MQTELALGKSDAAKDNGATDVRVPLPRIRQAASQEAVLVIPAHFQLPEALSGIELLPPGLCCDDGQLVDSNATDVVAVRYDASAFAKMDLRPQPLAQKSGWVHSQLHEHWQYQVGRTLHRSTWDIANPTARALEFDLPAHWKSNPCWSTTSSSP